MKSKPKKADLQRLYKAADSYRKLAPWDWMFDDQIFGVTDPVTGEIGYCDVLGALGEVYALVVYEGDEGLRSFFALINAESPEEARMNIVGSQKALMASFEKRRNLAPEDVTVIQSLGLSFHGKNAWPQFRHYLPGFLPWFLDGWQTAFLATVLEQALNVLPRVRDNAILMPDLDDGLLLMRTPSADQDGRLHWRDEMIPFSAPAPIGKTRPTLSVDEVGLERIRKKAKRTDAVWEIGYGYAPMPIQEKPGKRPYFPPMILVLDHGSGMVLSHSLEDPDGYEQKFRNYLIRMMSEMALVPRRILVSEETATMIVAPIASGLKIELQRVKELPAFKEAYQHMMNTMK